MMPLYTADYVLPLLERAIDERNDERGNGGAAKVAAELGTSDSLISQLRGNTYPSPQKWYPKIVAHYGNETVICPTLGEIALSRCSEEKHKPAAAPSAAYVQQRRACSKCRHKGSKP